MTLFWQIMILPVLKHSGCLIETKKGIHDHWNLSFRKDHHMDKSHGSQTGLPSKPRLDRVCAWTRVCYLTSCGSTFYGTVKKKKVRGCCIWEWKVKQSGVWPWDFILSSSGGPLLLRCRSSETFPESSDTFSLEPGTREKVTLLAS